MKKGVMLLFLTLILIASCSKKEAYEIKELNGYKQVLNSGVESSPDMKIPIDLLTTVENQEDDTSYVIAHPGDRFLLLADTDNEGNVYTLNYRKSQVMKFDKDGNFLKVFGGKGQGPGEFPAMPSDISIFDGKIYVADLSGRLSIFNMDGEFIEFDELKRMRLSPRTIDVKSNGKVIMGESFDGQWGTDSFKWGYFLYLLKGEEPKKFYGELEPFDIQKIDTETSGGVIYTVTEAGETIVAVTSKKEYKIEKYDVNGKKILEIVKRYAPVKRPAEEIEEIKNALDNFTKQSGGMYGFKDPSEFRTPVLNVFTDKNGNIWASIDETLFSEEGQIFDIYSKEGVLLKTVKFDEFKQLRLYNTKNGKIIGITTAESSFSDGVIGDPVIKVFDVNIDM